MIEQWLSWTDVHVLDFSNEERVIADDVWGHSLSDLCEDAMAFDPGFDALKPTAALLDKYFESTRYPTGLPGGIPAEAYDREDAVRAVQIANEVLDFVKPRME